MNSYDVKLDQGKLVGLLSTKEGIAERLEAILNQYLELQMKDHLGADKYQHSPERQGYRNGDRPRQLYTRVGTLTLQAPQNPGW